MKTDSSFVTKDQFVGILRDCGVTEEQMSSLHRLFEKRYPSGHEAFLRALQLDDTVVAEIRQRSR